MKKSYERAALTAVRFDAKDVITTSSVGVIVFPPDDLTTPNEVLG